jgi:hypothetical protein
MTQADTPVTPVHYGQLGPAASPGPLSECEARQLTREIADTLALAWDKIVEAYQRRVWEPLGYRSWDCYCRAELGSTRLRLPSEEREEAVRSLRSAGLSTRAIASATGISKDTVRRTMGGSHAPLADANPHPAPAVTGLNGKTYTSSHTATPTTDHPIDAEIVDEQEPHPVLPAPAAPAPPATTKRRPLTEQAKDAGWEIRRAAERIARIVGDDRLPTHHQQVSFALRTHLLFTAQTVTTALNQLPHHN